MNKALPVTAAQLSRFEPLSALSVASIDRLVAISQVHKVAQGADILSLAEWRNRIVYLLSGELTLRYPDQLVVVVVGGSGQGLQPVINGHVVGATMRSRVDKLEPVAMQAITACTLVSLDEESIDLVATWDQLASPRNQLNSTGRVANVETAPEWRNLSGLCADQSLVTSAFATIPPANIPRLLQCFSRFNVIKGDVIIRQGDAGDFYYLIERGRCRVTRQIAGVESDIAELCDGEGFGEESLVSAVPRNATVTMKTDGVIWRLAKQDFSTLLQQPLLRRASWQDSQVGALVNATWIDTRFPAEFKQNGIPGAINIPLNEIRQATAVLDPKKDYVVYCQTGRRSSAAAFLLSQHGISAYLLDGGLNAAEAEMELSA